MMMLRILARFLAISLIILQANYVNSTALDDYVWKVDENYGWKDLDATVTDKVVGRGYTGIISTLISYLLLNSICVC